ncbi:MAG: PKD domain-containing protein, partial [Bacteroidetes bacterium]|nr:PKD domain-containing protein [Bacteroidota bacterium]
MKTIRNFKMMNTLGKIAFIIGIITFTSLLDSCKKDKVEETQTKSDLPDMTVWNVSQETNWDYWVVGGKYGDYFYIDVVNSKPKSVYFYSAKDADHYSVTFDASGLPDKVVVKDYIFVFGNFQGNSVDIGVVYPNGDTEVVKNITTSTNWDAIYLRTTSTNAKSDIIKWTGRAIGGIPCVISAFAAVASGGAGIPVTVLVCGNYLAGLAAGIAQDQGIDNTLTQMVDDYNMVTAGISCATTGGFDCLAGIASTAFTEYAENMNDISNHSTEINDIESAMNSGSGNAPVADFSATVINITEGGTVTFADLSTNTPTSWLWDFGDGATSTSKNPSHIYSVAGNYDVSLTATNSYGSNTVTKN